MKKLLTILLSFILLCGCSSKKNNEIASKIFFKLEKASTCITEMSDEMMSIWDYALDTHNKYNLDTGSSFSLLLDNTSIEDDYMYEALAHLNYNKQTTLDLDYFLSHSKEFRSVYFMRIRDQYNYNDVYLACHDVLLEAYKQKGYNNTIETSFTDFTALIQELDENSEHYDNLKQYYAVLQSYYDYLYHLPENISEAERKVNDYKSTIENLHNNLYYYFEEQ